LTGFPFSTRPHRKRERASARERQRDGGRNGGREKPVDGFLVFHATPPPPHWRRGSARRAHHSTPTAALVSASRRASPAAVYACRINTQRKHAACTRTRQLKLKRIEIAGTDLPNPRPSGGGPRASYPPPIPPPLPPARKSPPRSFSLRRPSPRSSPRPRERERSRSLSPLPPRGLRDLSPQCHELGRQHGMTRAGGAKTSLKIGVSGTDQSKDQREALLPKFPLMCACLAA
jgi:hypothetical protein